jgi:hypothetical protein
LPIIDSTLAVIRIDFKLEKIDVALAVSGETLGNEFCEEIRNMLMSLAEYLDQSLGDIRITFSIE